MNILTAISEALQSANEMDRQADSILGLYGANPQTKTNGRAPVYSAYSRRRDRVKRAA